MPAARSQFRAHPLAYAGLAALFLFSLTAFARELSDSVDLIRHLTEYVRPPFYLGDANWGAVELQPEAEAAGAFRSQILAPALMLFGSPSRSAFVAGAPQHDDMTLVVVRATGS